jgi:hypothetical protein
MERFSFNHHDEYSEPTEREVEFAFDEPEYFDSPDYRQNILDTADPKIVEKVKSKREENSYDWCGNIVIW